MAAAKRIIPTPKRVSLEVVGLDAVSPEFQRGVLAFAGARQAFTALLDHGMDQSLLWCYLFVCHLKYLEQFTRRQAKMKPAHALNGFPQYTLRRLPQRIRKMAREIYKLNEAMQSNEVYRAILEELRETCGGPLFGSVHQTKRIQLKFAELPDLLRGYADHVKMVNNIATRVGLKTPRTLLGQTELIQGVKEATGRPHFSELARLLTAATTMKITDTVERVGSATKPLSRTYNLERTVDPRNLKPRK